MAHHDCPAACAIAQQYGSTNFISLPAFKNVIIEKL
jgi:hypothetical protein